MKHFEPPYWYVRTARYCPVSASAIASQLVRNGRYAAVDCKSSRIIFQEVPGTFGGPQNQLKEYLSEFFTERIHSCPPTLKSR